LREHEVQAHADIFKQRLSTYPDWPELEELGACPITDVPTSDRPAVQREG
jgi:glutathione-regulated potassium-efflux system ancillary protein KefF